MRMTEEQYQTLIAGQRKTTKLGHEEPPMPGKYRNKKVTVNGEKYDSKREYSRYQQLKMMERAGKIAGLERQVKFELAPAVTIKGRKRPPLRYFADFVYTENGQTIVEDAKGTPTKEYIIKRHLMKAVHGIDIQEV